MGKLSLYRVSVIGTVEVCGYSRGEAVVRGIEAVAKGSGELLRPLLCQLVSEVEEYRDEGEEEEAGGKEVLGVEGVKEDGGEVMGQEFRSDDSARERWVTEMMGHIPKEVIARIKEELVKEEESKPGPIPIR